MNKLSIFLLFLLPVLTAAGQSPFSGRIVDGNGQGVPYVTVVVQDADSVVVDAVLSDIEGRFTLGSAPARDGIILVQHLSYETAVLSGAELIAEPTVAIRERENTIDDVVVRGERPMVTIVGNMLSYDAEVLTKDRIVDTAMDVIRELPGMSGSGDELQLVGAGKFTIVINGQITSMSLSELFALLRTIPASQVKRLNVAYNAPAKYNFNGAVIEVELADNTGYEGTTGEVSGSYQNKYYSGGSLRGSVNVERERFSLNILGEAGRRQYRGIDSTVSRHQLAGDLYDIYQNTQSKGRPTNYSLRVGSDFKLGGDANLNFSYYYRGSNTYAENRGDNIFRGPGLDRDIMSANTRNSNTHLHNLHLQYDGLLTAGADYTRYHSPDRGRYEESDNGVVGTGYTYRSSQTVDKLNFFANRNSQINTWNLGYGLNFSTATSDNRSDYNYFLPADRTVNVLGKQSEYFANAFFELSKQINERLNFKVGIKGEYQYSNIENNGVKRNIWSEWTVYPDASLTYMPSDKHILQFDFTSDKTYPPYWALSTDRSQLNAYSYVVGNPNLKPSREYEGQLRYIFNRKYILMAHLSYAPDTFRQMPYQLDNELQLEYEFTNFDFSLQYGFVLIVPFKIGKVLDSRVVINAVEMVDRIKDFKGINVRNNAFLVLAAIRNTIPLYHGTKTKLDFQVDFQYQGQAVQGIMDLGEGYSLNAGLKWTINEKLTASARWDNILRRQTPRPIKVDYGNQYSRMTMKDFSTVTLNLTWRFGKYEEKRFRSVDSSRFGKN